MLERFCGEVWVDGGEMLGGEEAEEGVAERGEELVCLGGEFRAVQLLAAVRGVGETCQERGVEGGGGGEGEA